MESFAPHLTDPRRGEHALAAGNVRYGAPFHHFARLLLNRLGFTTRRNSSGTSPQPFRRDSSHADERGQRQRNLAAHLLTATLLLAALPPLPANAIGLPAAGEELPQPTQGHIGDPTSWQAGEYEIEPLATYDITARVLSVKHYPGGTDRFAEVSSVDLALGWGPMADRQLLEQLNVRQEGRWYFVKWRGLPLTAKQVIENSANTHILPASADISAKLANVKAGDLVTLKGYLVDTRGSDGWTWPSSTTRTDTGGGSCESLWVESVEIHPDAPITYASIP